MRGDMAYVRNYYNVPAKRGGRVLFQGFPGRILSADNGRLNLLLDTGQMVSVHPTWEMGYLGDE
jgi:hypothetical protein